jgi:hypothetical protein
MPLGASSTLSSDISEKYLHPSLNIVALANKVLHLEANENGMAGFCPQKILTLDNLGNN